MTGWACLGLEASGRNPRDLRRGGQTPISYLRRTAGEIRSVGDIERTALVLVGAGLDPRKFAAGTWWPACATTASATAPGPGR